MKRGEEILLFAQEEEQLEEKRDKERNNEYRKEYEKNISNLDRNDAGNEQKVVSFSFFCFRHSEYLFISCIITIIRLERILFEEERSSIK